MLEVPIYDKNGETVDRWSVDEGLLGGALKPRLLKQAYVRAHANRRQGSAVTRGRGRVAGTNAKAHRQKGTGMARRGNKKTNILVGGGVAFEKRPKSWRQGMPDRQRRLANRNALLAKLVDEEVKVVNELAFEQPRTRPFVQMLGALGVDRSCLVALADATGPTALSARNVDETEVIRVDQLNAFEMLNHRYLVAQKDVLAAWIGEGGGAPAGKPASEEPQAA
jgi:large subunit ribosomal protein L4